MPNKMTDNEIIKALKECEECHYFNECEKSLKLALDLINRQQAEIERLKEAYSVYEETAGLKQAKAKAVKEFAERLKKQFGCGVDILYEEWVVHRAIDDLLKETVGENGAD